MQTELGMVGGGGQSHAMTNRLGMVASFEPPTRLCKLGLRLPLVVSDGSGAAAAWRFICLGSGKESIACHHINQAVSAGSYNHQGGSAVRIAADKKSLFLSPELSPQEVDCCILLGIVSP